LINEGGYPYRVATASTWCHRLVAGLDEHDFHLVTIVDGPLQRSYPVLTNNPSLTPVPLAGRPVAPEKGPARTQHRRAATHAAVLLCRGMLDDSPHGATMFRTALRRLTGLAADGTHPLVGVPLAQVLLDAWRTAAGSGRTSLARITMADAEIAGYLLESSLRVLSVAPPEVELCHVVDGGLATLVALGARWRAGVPYVVTEHDAYLRAELAERVGPRPGVRAVLLRFLRALNRPRSSPRANGCAGGRFTTTRTAAGCGWCRPGSIRRTIRGWTTRRTTPSWPGSGPPRSCPCSGRRSGRCARRCPTPGWSWSDPGRPGRCPTG
jgi:hypothetical protein